MRRIRIYSSVKVLLGRLIARQRATYMLWRAHHQRLRADFRLIQLKEFRKSILSHSGHSKQIIHTAERIVAGEYSIFSQSIKAPKIVLDWKRDYFFDHEWSRESTDHRGLTDIKNIWEMSRMQFLPVVGLAFFLTGEKKYFDFIKSTLLDWNENNPVFSHPNWDNAMEVALRSVSILLTLNFLKDELTNDAEFFESINWSLVQHVIFIECNLEIGFYGTKSNHFLSDVLGLLLLGLAFRESEIGKKWTAYALQELERGIAEDVGDDGIYFEHSTSYHAFVLEIFTYGYLIGKQNGAVLSKHYKTALEKMFECASYCVRPDGVTVQAGDADDGGVLILTDYFGWNRRDHSHLLHLGSVLFDRSDLTIKDCRPSIEQLLLMGGKPHGLHKKRRIRKGQVAKLFDAKVAVLRNDNDYLMVTAWDVGTYGIGNHQHNDILSFELAIGGESFFVDPGCYNYTRFPQLRNLFRSTSYHNTVRIDGQEINPFSDNVLFRMSERAHPRVITFRDTKKFFVFEAEHSGYTRLPDSVLHKRMFRCIKAKREYQITDLIHGAGRHTLETYFHLDQSVIPTVEHTRVVLRKNRKRICIEIEGSHAAFEIEKGWLSPSYLQKVESRTLKLKMSFEKSISLQYRIYPL